MEDLALEELLDAEPGCEWDHYADAEETGIPSPCSETAVYSMVDCEESILMCQFSRDFMFTAQLRGFTRNCGPHDDPSHIRVIVL